MDQVKKQAGLAKLQGELVLLDRQITLCKEQQGAIIYNALAQRWHNEEDANNEKDASAELPLPGLEAAFQATSEDLLPLNGKRNQLQDQLEVQNTAPQGMSSFFTNAKLSTELAYYEREIKLRLGIFGHQLFDDLKLLDANDGQPFPETDDYNVGQILNEARNAMCEALQQKKDKEDEMEAAKAADVTHMVFKIVTE